MKQFVVGRPDEQCWYACVAPTAYGDSKTALTVDGVMDNVKCGSYDTLSTVWL